MIEIRSETMLPLRAAAATFPGGKRHVSTVHRYRLDGVAGVRLEALKVGGRWYTSAEAIERFVAALNVTSRDELAMPKTPAARAFGDAEKGLDEAWGPST
jgi:hypothetical protein